ncbi:MAG: hypothetical protein ABJF10_17905 [Chthoniobacter sp.]|uniref:hypothetical protein n=1 Tax=Chthoniobacter sp. TaxID=2510640 RepID=UPI0032A630EB
MKILQWIVLAVILGLCNRPRAVAIEPTELTIKAWVDGPSELRIKKNGIYWKNGENAKPGRQSRLNEPTYTNGKPWVPHWKKQHEDRGRDKSDTLAMDIPSLNFDFKLVAVAEKFDGTGVEQRGSISVYMKDFELAIAIPDLEPGTRWYTFTLTPRKPVAK